MRIVLVHPNYHSGGAEIAGNWPPAWVAYLAGYLKKAGYTDITFIDAMTDHNPVAIPHNAMWKTMHRPKVKLSAANAAMACGGGKDQLEDADAPRMKACGGGTPHLAQSIQVRE